MFSSLGRFQALPCPFAPHCSRPTCLFSHSPDAREQPLHIPFAAPTPAPAPPPASTVPAKRLATPPSVERSSSRDGLQPPRKLQRTGPPGRPVAIPSASKSASGVPVLRVNAGQSKIPTSTRQAMIKNLYDHFIVLYDAVLPLQPSLASEHALRQEEEIYARTTKFTYRNAVISSIASLKARPPPTSLEHPSIGTTGDLASGTPATSVSKPSQSAAASPSPALPNFTPKSTSDISALSLTPAHLHSLLLDPSDLPLCNYIPAVDPSWGPGGESPDGTGERRSCERCGTKYVVRAVSTEGAGEGECLYHWGKPFSRMINGERSRLYTCCSRPTADGGGCTRGPHVFYESEPRALHRRHAFSPTRPWRRAADSKGKAKDGASDTALEMAALDCEMVYSTGGFRVARVSVVDGNGKEVFDELVRMDEGVEVVDFNTRFSGLTPQLYAESARLPLSAIRRALDALISEDTILMGHALDNDLRALRMVHSRCVDTAIIFGRLDGRGGVWRRALRDLTKEHLGRSIQTGDGSSGHSSVEDSVATLDLVKWCVLNRRQKPNLSSSPLKATPTKQITASVSVSITTDKSKSPGLGDAVGAVVGKDSTFGVSWLQ
ncbi:ribonuclease H-like protein [Dentipellis sp. KUC8613]|nr:ribonuclease H-like protein [Dentipellis sp. KUC8613]